MVKRSYYDILTEAMTDLEAHGYDSAARVEYWSARIREAAEAAMGTTRRMEEMLRDAYAAIYKKMIERGGIVEMHPGVDRWTLSRVSPALRGELDRRILAAADLIKLNREQAVAKTLQRFRGWSTSIPAGGTSSPGKGKAKDDVRKALARLPFEERRVLIDQGHKLTAALSEIVAKDQGAIAVVWHSHWRQANYDYRPKHKERDGRVYAIRDSWAIKRGLVRKGPDGYYDEITAVGEEPFCRCYATYIYNLRQLPAEMLTKKGAAALEEARKKVRADAEEAALPLLAVRRLDRLGYGKGVRSIEVVPDDGPWNASYCEGGRIEVQEKLLRESEDARTHVLLHEFGHCGEDHDPATFAEFERLGLGGAANFLGIANGAHLCDYARTGKLPNATSEAFAESYARMMLRKSLPEELREFWERRIGEGPPAVKQGSA